MVSSNALSALIDQAQARGAQVDIHLDTDALYFEGREVITEVRIEGLAGIGLHWMPAITAAERIRIALLRAIEEAGFDVSGPTDSRAAEHGEPAWVCKARAALAG
ncbi:hypothetical protein [Xanthomonas citri]|uniref:hypothetical protein n=1 Tax=Xanthomonas citri TaxID=346 RepID=UPI0009C1BD28|nr:hypothetical protein [Xanthomonas citri]AMV02098.1 hypothetical protein TP50_06290 [Xanthomonas citri pv. aurantifolii]TBW92966.1 hypothetical protein TP49_23720 [Xanthomonas citri pv. aurantifolii]